jgi:hypothetical protein
MSGISRPAKGLTTSAALLAVLLLASCGSSNEAAAPAADETAVPADAATDAAMEPAAEPTMDAAEPEAAEAAPAVPGKGGAQPASQPASQAAPQPAYVGSWGVDLAQCALEQEYEGSPMILYADGFDQHEAHCGFDSVTQTGPDQWHVTGTCSVEGEPQVIDDNIAVVDGNLQHWAGNSRKDAWTLVRCPE